MAFSSSDKKWQRFNQKLEKLMKVNDFFGLGTTYYEMAAFVAKEGGDPKPYRDQGYKMKLQSSGNIDALKSYIESNVVQSVEILAAPDSCTLCNKLSGKKLSLETALQEPIIPVKDCTHKYGCRCVYLPSITI